MSSKYIFLPIAFALNKFLSFHDINIKLFADFLLLLNIKINLITVFKKIMDEIPIEMYKHLKQHTQVTCNSGEL